MDAAPHGVDGGSRTVLAVRELSKTFLGQKALDRVSFELAAGEVHGLIGQNGSGKSTLIKCLAGYHEPDPGGSIVLEGRELALPYSSSEATALGMVFVHQDLGLIRSLSVAENFAIPRRYGTRSLARIDWKGVRRRATEELEAFGHAISPNELVGRLSVAEQTIVAIARALASAAEGAKVLVLDEPTAALPDARRNPSMDEMNEVELLFAAVRQVVAKGVGVIYVSHKLHEILSLADRATILRDGRNVETVSVPGLTEKELIRLIVGRDVRQVAKTHVTAAQAGEHLLEVKGLGGNRLSDINFNVDRGEVVGLAGMLGSGRTELARMIFGADRPDQGEIRLRGSAVHHASPADAVRNGVALVPEDRRRQGGFLALSVANNLTLPSIRSFFRSGRISGRAERARVTKLIADYDIRPPMPSRRFGNLSGGNQQKVVIAKWLDTEPDLVIFDEPVQGVDVGARAEIYEAIVKAAERGAGVILISSELDDMLDLCDRVLVLRNGRLVAERLAGEFTRQSLTQLVYFGQTGDEPTAGELSLSPAT
jgi:ribose transport system ATP-binding protein